MARAELTREFAPWTNVSAFLASASEPSTSETSSTPALRMRACSPFVDIRVLYEYSPIVDLAKSSTVVSAPESRPPLFWPAPP